MFFGRISFGKLKKERSGSSKGQQRRHTARGVIDVAAKIKPSLANCA
jgi:hypothetical protein